MIGDLKTKPMQSNQEGIIKFVDSSGRTVIRQAHAFYILKVYETEIWDMCDGCNTIDDMAMFVSKKYGVEFERALAEIQRFLLILMNKNLLL